MNVEARAVRLRLHFALASVVLLALGLAAWAATRVARGERAEVRRRMTDLLRARLGDAEVVIKRVVERRERDLRARLDPPPSDAAEARRRWRGMPGVRGMFVVEADGRLAIPDPRDDLPAPDRGFLRRARQVLGDRAFFRRGAGEGGAAPHGWAVIVGDEGTTLLFWVRDAAGRVAGAEVDHARLLADVIAELPEDDATGRMALVDPMGAPAYLWGTYEPAPREPPRASLRLGAPLLAWRLECWAPDSRADAALGGFQIVPGIAALGLALVGFAVYFARESTRAVREAAERVSFVNRVSHELRTPLTNIRMYAELLEDDLPDEAADARRRLGVIVSESERLGRLIANVLTFARAGRGALALRLAPGSVGDVVRGVIERFEPSLRARGVRATVEGAADATVRLDADAVEQIMANLVGNVEKYAAGGGRLDVALEQRDSTTVIVVSDHGPGIPAAARERVFLPFVRLSDRLADGATGTGIGLTISRELARLHGGDLMVDPSERGARFRLAIHTPPAADAAAEAARAAPASGSA